MLCHQIQLKIIIFDHPARSFIKMKSHSGYHSCDKCIQQCVYRKHKTTFPLVSGPYIEKHKFPSTSSSYLPLRTSDVNMAMDVPKDYIHFLCLDVVRWLVFLWTVSPVTKGVRFNSQQIVVINGFIKQLRLQLPNEFDQKSRGWNGYRSRKATKFRQSLVYFGIVVLIDTTLGHVYVHFLRLALATHFLFRVSAEFTLNSAASMLYHFVRLHEQLCGLEWMSVNVYSLIHLSYDLGNHGPLKAFSAFPFEPHLFKIRSLIKRNKQIASQLVRRCGETGSLGVWLDGCAQSSSFVQKAKLVRNGYTVSTNFLDNVVLVNRDSRTSRTWQTRC